MDPAAARLLNEGFLPQTSNVELMVAGGLGVAAGYSRVLLFFFCLAGYGGQMTTLNRKKRGAASFPDVPKKIIT